MNRFFSIKDIEEVITEESDEFFYARVCVLSTRPNTQKINITKEILMRDGESIRGKWIVANPKNGEFMSHDKEEYIVGIVPVDTKIEYIDKEDGYTYMYVDAVLSKIYSKPIYEMFKYHNLRDVSVEMATADLPVKEDGSTPIEGLHFFGITILGAEVRPACSDANITVVKFSDKSAETFYKSFSDKEESNKSAIDSSNEKKESKSMEDTKVTLSDEEKDKKTKVEPKAEADEKEKKDAPVEKEKDTKEKAEPEKEKEAKKEEPKKDEEKKEMSEEPKAEEKKETAEEPKKDEKKEDKEKDFTCLETEEKEMSDNVRKVFSSDRKFAVEQVLSMAKELSALKKFKANIEQREKAMSVEKLMSSVKSSLSEKEFADFKAEGLACDNLDAFANKVKAFAYDKIGTENKSGMMEFSDTTGEHVVEELTADEIYNKYI